MNGSDKISLIDIMSIIECEYKKFYESDIATSFNNKWIINNWHINIKEFPQNNVSIFVKSYLYEIHKANEKRLFVIIDENNHEYAYIDSNWSLLNVENNSIVRNYNYGNKTDIIDTKDYIGYKKEVIPILNEGIDKKYRINESQIDKNSHLNNIEYIKLIYKNLKKYFDECEQLKIVINYERQTYLNDILILRSHIYNRNIICNFIGNDKEIKAKAKIELF